MEEVVPLLPLKNPEEEERSWNRTLEVDLSRGER
jgi:hypothetical protein